MLMHFTIWGMHTKKRGQLNESMTFKRVVNIDPKHEDAFYNMKCFPSTAKIYQRSSGL